MVISGGVVSITNSSGAASVGFPVGSVAVALTVNSPSGNGVVGVNVHVPSGLTIAGPDATGLFAASLITTSTVEPGSTWPVTSGFVLFVTTGLSIVISGGVVSTTNSSGAASFPLPAESFAVASTVNSPSGSCVVGVNVQLPSGSTVAGPSATTLSSLSLITTSTVEPGSVLPVNSGVVSLVSTGGLIETSGGVVSITNFSGVAVSVLPFGSFAVASTVYSPSGNSVDGVNDHVPSGLTVAGP